MRVAKEIIALDALPAGSAADIAALRADVLGGFAGIVWPPGADTFSINPVRLGNGVTPIKTAMMEHLDRRGWSLEAQIVVDSAAGPVDAAKTNGTIRACLEWETGNVASSYRALLKMMDALAFDRLDAGFLVVSNKRLARYLTDRIGTFEEISWSLRMLPQLYSHGYIEILVMEPDYFDSRVSLIPKQLCGNGIAAKRAGKRPGGQISGQLSLLEAVGIVEGADGFVQR